VKIETDCRAADAECAGKNLLDEIPGRSRRKRGVELHDDRSVEPAGSQEAQLVLLAGQLKQGFLGPQEQSRVRCERQRRHLPLELARALERRADHRTMAAMDAIEITDRNHGAGKGPAVDAIRAAAHDMKSFGRRVRLVHQEPQNLQRSGPMPGTYLIIRTLRQPVRLARR
jgi:hypothetical protein